MRTFIACAAVVAAVAASSSPAQASPGNFVGTTCGLVGFYDEGLALGNPASVFSVMFAAIVAVDPADTVHVACEFEIQTIKTRSADSGAPGRVAVVQPVPHVDRAFSTIPQSVNVTLCTALTVNGVTSRSCETVTRNGVPPQEVCDLALEVCEADHEEVWWALPDPVSG